MEPNQDLVQNYVYRVTPLSKYLALLLFILMPFIGGWIGYTYAPVKTVLLEKIVTSEPIVREMTREEIEKAFINDVGAVFAISLTTPLVLSGVVKQNEMLDPAIVVELDAESVAKLPSGVPRTENGIKNMVFANTQQVIGKRIYLDGTKVKFTLADYHYDTRRVETFDSGVLLSFDEVQ